MEYFEVETKISFQLEFFYYYSIARRVERVRRAHSDLSFFILFQTLSCNSKINSLTCEPQKKPQDILVYFAPFTQKLHRTLCAGSQPMLKWILEKVTSLNKIKTIH